jgi:hypothetical protein
MGDRMVITETDDKPKPDTIIVVPNEKPKAEKEVVVTETTKIKTKDE